MKQLSTLLMVPDAASRTQTISVLLQAGISARGCSTPLELFGLMAEENYDAVILDISDLGELGYALIARLRGSAGLGVIVTGADLPTEARLRCLQSGADACLPAPLDDRELAGVLLALARRLPVWLNEPAPTDLIALDPADTSRWELRDQDWTLGAPNGVLLSLSANERQILRVLLESPGRAVTREQLAEELAADGVATRVTGARSIDVVVSRLRRKAEQAGVILPIRTVYGSGYLFANP
ncbi:hypothetical protein CEG14_25390 [Bordetella genomosp. 1]|uniref:DNA-binding response regulator n=1 Tax=Bordetella genomosp. 1 TaxID=1395607 RepID=A0A261RUJ3_9BORD|nr:response regulator transcription factor [Bordetella genomosp. 1]MDQ8033343.1 response regulator transcription factor [Bordetella sp.]OZI28250.1 hypothetical protein CEG14_25390 [Bordetella genomosp. 1]OZI68340.1 hypothetical protein CAL27_02380 [Bordetella genomosp. 1]